ncbi:MAG: diaminopimelate decarboxylase, partial [Armatimonadetes bacterium]|nr:diaminopimelate decarboxylase [Armatimonadota bacterium]
MLRFGTQSINDQGHLMIGGCDVLDLAAEFGTPLYVLDEALVRENCREYQRAFRERYPDVQVAFAGKALLCQAVCAIMQQEGMLLDVASRGELHTALSAGFPPERIHLHGNCKTEADLTFALDADVHRIVVDSLPELRLLAELASRRGVTADIQIRVGPGVKTQTHTFIQTGQDDSKFGLGIASGAALEAVKLAAAADALRLCGLHAHIGSQLFGLDSYRRAVEVMAEFAAQVAAANGGRLEELNLGGGLGIQYTHEDAPPTIDELAEVITAAARSEFERVGLPPLRLMLEPGRSIVGPAGTTLYRVIVVKELPGLRTYVSVDGGLSDNPRPCMYGAEYEAVIANKAGGAPEVSVRVSGAHCETDTLIPDTVLQRAQPGDLLAVFSTGAYNYSMASNYNRFCRPAMVAVHDGAADVIV